MILDNSWIQVACPQCGYESDVTLLDVRLQSRVFCHNCKVIINIIDNNVEVYKAVNDVDRMLRNLFKRF